MTHSSPDRAYTHGTGPHSDAADSPAPHRSAARRRRRRPTGSQDGSDPAAPDPDTGAGPQERARRPEPGRAGGGRTAEGIRHDDSADVGRAGLHGRDTELGVLESLLSRLAGGRGASLVVTAEPGMGRTALLRELARRAGPAALTLGTRGIRAERGLDGSGLHRLLAPVQDRLVAAHEGGEAELAAVTGRAARGIGVGAAFRLRTAVHRLLTGLAREQPVVCWVDDAHWLDSASLGALAFSARRLDTEPVLIVFSVAEGPGAAPCRGALADIATLRLAPLGRNACHRIVADPIEVRRAAGQLPEEIADEIVAQVVEAAGGNPLALTEIIDDLERAANVDGPDRLDPTAPWPLPEHSRLRAEYQHRCGLISPEARRLLPLVIAAGAAGRPVPGIVRRAAELARVDLERLGELRGTGLVRLEGESVLPPSPVIAATLSGAFSPSERSAAHVALAQAYREEGDMLHSALHRASAARDEGGSRAGAAVAELVRAATGAERTGAYSAAARAWEHAAALTPMAEPVTGPPDFPWEVAAGPPAVPDARSAGDGARSDGARRAGTAGPSGTDPDLRERRLVSAATCAWLAGQTGRARTLLSRCGPGGPGGASPTGSARSRVLGGFAGLLRGEMELRCGHPARAQQILIEAAALLSGADLQLELDALMRACEACGTAGDHATYVLVAERAAALGGTQDAPRVRLMLDHCAGMAAILQGRHRQGAPALRRVCDLAEDSDDFAACVWGAMTALLLGEDLRAHRLATRAAHCARESGAVTLVPSALVFVTLAELWLGRYRAAAASALEGLRLAQATHQSNNAADHLAALALLAAFQGDRQTVDVRLKALDDHAAAHGLARPERIGSWALACLDLAEDRPADALARLRLLPRLGSAHPVVRVMAVPHLVEAAVLSGRGADADADADAEGEFRLFELWATGTHSPGRLAQAERCRALLAKSDDSAEQHFEAAVGLHRRSESAFELARTDLLYGGWLRRRRRPRQAREHLRNALQIFQRYDTEPWIARAAAELRASGENAAAAATRSSAPAVDELTPQQQEIARLVCEGATNREIAGRLFLSPRTIDHHLRNIFTKLGIRSRVELAGLLR